jgi:predicted DNA-binding protein (MmcQ/YjbR family)
MAARDKSTDSAVEELRAFGLTYPGAHTKSPWPGHLDLAVNDKTFAYLNVAGDPFKLSCKLPHSSEEALSLPFAEPTPYGLGKSGWVTAQLPSGPVPVEMFKAWIDESYRAQAPKRLSAGLPPFDADSAATTPPLQPAKKGPAKKGPAKKQPLAAKKRPKSAKAQASAQPRAAKRAASAPKPGKKRAAAARRAG